MRELFLLLIGLLYCVTGSLLTYVSVLLVTRKVNDYQLINDQRLPDIFLNLIPEYVFLFKFTEGSIIIFLILNILLIILHKKKKMIIKRTLVIFGTIYWVRFLTLMVTFFPVPNDRTKCPTEKYVVRGFLGVLQDLKGIVMTFGLMNSGMVSCGDSMFSGHAASIMILASTLTHYIPKHLKPLRYVIWTWGFLAIISILLSHMHYTMDIIVGVWLSRHIFTMYYQIVFIYEIFNASQPENNITAAANNITAAENNISASANNMSSSSSTSNNNITNNNTNNIARGAGCCSNNNVNANQLEHTIFMVEDNAEERIITATYLLQNFGLFFWLNPIFIYFEKNAKHQENILVFPKFVLYVADQIRKLFLRARVYVNNRSSNTTNNDQLLL